METLQSRGHAIRSRAFVFCHAAVAAENPLGIAISCDADLRHFAALQPGNTSAPPVGGRLSCSGWYDVFPRRTSRALSKLGPHCDFNVVRPDQPLSVTHLDRSMHLLSSVQTFGNTISVLPATDEPQIFFSTAAILVSLTAIIAAFFLAKGNRIAHRVWLALVAFSFAEALVYVLVDFANWGSLPRAGTQSQESIIPLGWAASYLAAFLTVRFGKARPKSTSLNDGH